MKTMFIIGLIIYGVVMVYANLRLNSYKGMRRKDN